MDKLLAFLFMAIDHAGVILFPSNALLRLIGRFAMPIYAYGIAKGYYFSVKHNTLTKYKRNLFVLALVSQIPFMVMVGDSKLNICYTWLLAIYLMEYILNKKYIKLYILIFVYSFLQVFLPVDYGMLGLLLPIGFYCFEKDFFEQEKRTLSLMIYPYVIFLTLFYALIDVGDLRTIQYYCVLFVPILNFALSKKFDKVIIPKWINYCFYPLSMIPFLMIKYLM
jgi:hypothetical protein